MRHFVAESIHHLRGQTVGGIPLFEAQMITRLFLHSKNAAPHFKSSKSLHCPSHSPLNVKNMDQMALINQAVSGGGTLPCPGGPKSHITEIKPMSFICFDNQCRDLELLKCCAALSECRKSRVIIWASKSGVPPTVCPRR